MRRRLRRRSTPERETHRTLTRRDLRHAPVHDQQFAERRIAGHLADGLAMGGQAVETAIRGRYDDRDHLALQLAEAGVGQHQVVVHADEGAQFGLVEAVRGEHVRQEADLLVAEVEVLAQVRVEAATRRDRQFQADDLLWLRAVAAGHGGVSSWRGWVRRGCGARWVNVP